LSIYNIKIIDKQRSRCIGTPIQLRVGLLWGCRIRCSYSLYILWNW